MEFILQLIGITLLFIGITRFAYIFTRDKSEPTWLNTLCAAVVAAFATFAIVAVIVMPSHAIAWEEAKEKMQYDINQHGIGILVENMTDSTNITMKKHIQELLNQYKFTQPYQESVFDCTDSSAIVQELLKENGYDAKLIYGADTRSVEASMWHMWVAIKDEKNDYVLIETTKQPTIGSVIRYRPKDESQYRYFQGGMMLNNSDEYAYYHESDKTHWNAASAIVAV